MYLTLELLEMTLKTSPIPTRNWKNSKDPVTERDRKRKESQQSVDRRIHYLWFHFLKLCLELESIGHVFEKKGGGGKIILGKGIPVRVNRDVYVRWDLENLRGMKFNDWYYGDNKRDLFNEGGFKYSGRPQYHSLEEKSMSSFVTSMERQVTMTRTWIYVRGSSRYMRRRGLSN